jgi:hypothetical protein
MGWVSLGFKGNAHRHATFCLAFYLTHAFCCVRNLAIGFLVRLFEAFCYVGNLAIGFLFQLLEALCCVRNLAIGFLVRLLESQRAG